MSVQTIAIPENFSFENANSVYRTALRLLRAKKKAREIIFDFSSTKKIDSGGVAVISRLRSLAAESRCEVTLAHCSQEILNTIETFQLVQSGHATALPKKGFFEKSGEAFYNGLLHFKESILLFSNIFYWSLVSFFKPKIRRRGEVVHQSILIGVNALPIIALIAFLIGLILALQSVLQRQNSPIDLHKWVAQWITYKGMNKLKPVYELINGRISKFQVHQQIAANSDPIHRMHMIDITFYDRSHRIVVYSLSTIYVLCIVLTSPLSITDFI